MHVQAPALAAAACQPQRAAGGAAAHGAPAAGKSWCCPPLCRARHQVTRRHLAGIRAIALDCGAHDTAAATQHAEALAESFYGGVGAGQLALMRQTLMR